MDKGRADEKGRGRICPKCNAPMFIDKPIYFNRDNCEGDFLFREEIYKCRICGKVEFAHKNMKCAPKRFVKGQIITGGYEELAKKRRTAG